MITDQQRLAREAFNLDAAMAALPAGRSASTPSESHKGPAGTRLRSHLVADISDDLLREFAREQLKAVRCSTQYLDALRVVLGNQAESEKDGYVLAMNLRVPFAAQRVMRTIIDQMQACGISFGRVVGLGRGRSQVVQCFTPKRSGSSQSGKCAAVALEWRDRKLEASGDIRMSDAIGQGQYLPICYPFLVEADIPY